MVILREFGNLRFSLKQKDIFPKKLSSSLSHALAWFSDVRGRSWPLRFPSLPLPSDIVCARSCSWRQSTYCMARANHNARKKWSVEKSTNQFRMGVFFLDQIFGKWRFLSYVSILYPKNAVLSQTNSGSVLVLRWISRIAVSGRSLWDLRGTHYKILSCKYILQTSNEDLQYVCKKVLPKAEKDWKKDVKSKSLEDELRAEMSKNAAVRI